MQLFSNGRIRTAGVGLACLLVSGCMNPYYGYPYGQPMYSPPNMLNQNPGTLVIPESGSSYEPGTGTYDNDPVEDDFRKEDSRFFNSDDDGVPFPEDPNRNTFEDDLGASIDPNRSPLAEDGVRPVSHVMMPTEYGFDTANYEWLRGTLHYVPDFNSWFVQYSLDAKDQFRGSLRLQVGEGQMKGMREGDSVDVQGAVVRDPRGNGAVYRVDLIRPMATRG